MNEAIENLRPAKRERYMVRVDRSDGSRTYKGPLPRTRADREAKAWRDSFPEYGVVVLPHLGRGVRADVIRWGRATRDGGRYFPEERVEWGPTGERVVCSNTLRIAAGEVDR